jgi:hypothetical protein
MVGGALMMVGVTHELRQYDAAELTDHLLQPARHAKLSDAGC